MWVRKKEMAKDMQRTCDVVRSDVRRREEVKKSMTTTKVAIAKRWILWADLANRSLRLEGLEIVD